MRRHLARALAVCVAVTAATAAQESAVTTDQASEPVAGLLQIPDLVGDGCGAEAPTDLAVFDSPGSQTPRGVLRALVRGRSADGASCEDLAVVLRVEAGASVAALTEESDYEVRSLVVYERSGEWFRIALHPGSGWVRADRKNFLPYPDLLLDRLAYVRTGWNGKLWAVPGSGAGDAVPFEWRQHLGDDLNVEVLAVRRVGNDAWIQVRLVAERCGETVPGVREATGWIPAYTTAGKPAAWFYSRGC